MSHKIENAIISELSWTRDSDGHWKFSQYCDDILRIWDRKEDGFTFITTSNHIGGYCIKGQEDKWKTKMLQITINKYKEEVFDFNRTIDELIYLNQLLS